MRSLLRLPWLVTTLLLSICLAALGAPRVYADDSLCFSETGQCLSGRFRSFWEQNGGLAVFGYPTTTATPELNRDTGQWYLTQWFERARFEFHPEHAAPYDVLLGRLGDDRLTLQGIDWQSGQRERGPMPDCLWFAQTGYNVCNQAGSFGFKTFWQTHGLLDPQIDAASRSLALFGLPLTEARMETNANGDTVLTQWFERARFEWHPDQPDAFKVLLGLLGSELNSTFPQRISTTVIGQPVGSERSQQPYVYWIDGATGTPTLMRLVAYRGEPSPLTDQVDPRIPPAARGFGVAWVEATPDGRQQRVLLEHQPGHRYSPVVRTVLIDGGTTAGLNITSMALGDRLYYTDATPGHSGLYARSLDGGADVLIDPHGFDPVVGDYWLLWSTKTTNGATGSAYRETWTLQMRHLLSGEEHIITRIDHAAAGRFRGYSVGSDAVVWSFSAPDTDNRVYLYRMSSRHNTPLSPDAAIHPEINQATTLVVWITDSAHDRDPATTWSVQAYDLRSGKLKTIVSGIASRERPFASLGGDYLTLAIPHGAAQNQEPPIRALYLTNLAELMGR